jgi:aldehyde dehydrogenase (NAD+)
MPPTTPSARPEDSDTPPALIEAAFNAQAAASQSLRSSTCRDRKKKLVRLRDVFMRHRTALLDAFHKDLRKHPVEVDLTEMLPVVDELSHAISNLRKWMKPTSVWPTLTTLGTRAKVIMQPRGRCLIIGPWNYPINTLLGPLVSALAAGNTVILKPSEMTPHVNDVVASIVRAAFDASEVALIRGGAKTAQHLLSLPFDHVFFTGSPAVGKVVMKAAASGLTSVTLELGGKSPVIVDETADVKQAASLILWGKLTNTGQSCVAPDHVFVHRSIHNEFAQACADVVRARFGIHDKQMAASPDFGRMINQRHAERVGALIDDAVSRGAKVTVGGVHDSSTRYVAPTVLTDVPDAAKINEEEIFGPVLPIRLFDSLDDVIRQINGKPKPLALYVWTKRKEVVRRIERETASGGMGVNLCMQQYVHGGLPFGGVNNSGLGNAHGHYGFKAFSHERAVLASGAFLAVKSFFPPFTTRTAMMAKSLVRLVARL